MNIASSRPRETVEKPRMSAEGGLRVFGVPGLEAFTTPGVLRTTGVAHFFDNLRRFLKLPRSVVSKYYYYAMTLVVIAASCAFGQGRNTVLGYSGFIVTPTAEIFSDGKMTLNVGRIPKLYADNYMPYDRTAYIVAMGFMPFMEASIGFIRPDGFQGGVGDRTVAVRVRLLGEKRLTPALAIGVHDFFAIDDLNLEPVSAQHFTSSYITATKNVKLFNIAATVNIGYGPDWLPSNDRQLTGFFWGVQFSPLNQVHLLFENDAVHYNAGVRFCFFRHVNYMLSFWQLKYMMHQLSFSINL